MCVTNIYTDRYPDGKEISFNQTTLCPYGAPNRPCQKLSTLENPVRKIQFGEPTTEYMMNSAHRAFPNTPPRSSGGSVHRPERRSGGDRHSGATSDFSSSDESRVLPRRKPSTRRTELFETLRPTRQHRKERIVIVDSPPTPRTPPQAYNQTYTAPSSPATPPYIIDSFPPRDPLRGRPVIVDERPLSHAPRAPSINAVISDRQRIPRRRRSLSRNRLAFESPSSSHTSFDSRARMQAEEEERHRMREIQERLAREARIRARDEEIRRRPAIPVPPMPLSQRGFLRPVVDNPPTGLEQRMGGLTVRDNRREERREEQKKKDMAVMEAAEVKKRMEERDRAIRKRMVEREEEAALQQRLRERQMPNRRASVGMGGRRHRVLYDDGVYRWE